MKSGMSTKICRLYHAVQPADYLAGFGQLGIDLLDAGLLLVPLHTELGDILGSLFLQPLQTFGKLQGRERGQRSCPRFL